MINTLGELIHSYQTARGSSYHELRYHTRIRHEQMLRRIRDRHGDVPLSDIRAMTLKEWHLDWSANKTKIATGHSFVAQIRTLVGFGILAHEDTECTRLGAVLHQLRFPMSKPGTARMTFEQAQAICETAHEFARPSIALMQAIQFECGLRQRDLVGEVVPLDEPGEGLPWRDKKWMRGIRWDEIDGNLTLRHVTSKTQKMVTFNLAIRPLVMRELSYLATVHPGKKTGAVIRCETTGLPWIAGEMRRHWRAIATAAGVPQDVCNMHSRAGFITEAIESGADVDKVRHTATHSSAQTTQIYNRGNFEEADAAVMEARLARRAARKSQDRPNEGEAWIREHVNYTGDDCIQWPFSQFQGYGLVFFNGKRARASRVMCTLVNGEPPTPEHEAAHECGNGSRGCMNPNHLRWKTRLENRADCYRHGTAARVTGIKKMDHETVYAIRELEGYAPGTEVAAAFGVSDDTVYSIWKRRQWASLPERPAKDETDL